MKFITTAALTAATAAFLVFGLGPTQIVSPALALDDDEIYCWDRDDGELECDTVGNLKAECALADPENTSDVCAEVNKNKGVGFGPRPGNFSAGLMFQPDAFFAPGAGRPFGGSANQMRRTR